jgi:chemotaxis family two-component system response regulator Rcp1
MFRILLVEDNPGDVLLFREALRGRDLAYELIVAEDGEKALTILEKVGGADPSCRPDLVVLDVNIPRQSGQEVLRRVRGNPALAATPVVVLTSSASPVDKARATGSGADLYIQKSSSLDQILDFGETVENLLKGRSRA